MNPDQPLKQHLSLPHFLNVYGRILAIRLGLRFMGFRRLFHRLQQKTHRFQNLKSDDGVHMERVRQLSGIVSRVNRDFLIFSADCLEESLALWWLLRRNGIDPDFRIGVRTITGRFESHAWVEYQGMMLNDMDRISIIYTPMLTDTLEFDQQGL